MEILPEKEKEALVAVNAARKREEPYTSIEDYVAAMSEEWGFEYCSQNHDGLNGYAVHDLWGNWKVEPAPFQALAPYLNEETFDVVMTADGEDCMWCWCLEDEIIVERDVVIEPAW